MGLHAKVRAYMLAGLITAALATANVLPAFANETHRFEIPAADAPTAIRTFASQAEVQILVAGENIEDKRLNAVSGDFSTEHGLQLLLADSGLAAQYVADRSIALVAVTTSAEEREGNADDLSGGKETGTAPQEMQFVKADDGGNNKGMKKVGAAGSSVEAQTSKQQSVSEIVVTAQRREQRLIDTPISMTVHIGEELDASSETSLRDVLAKTPGVVASTALQMN